MASSDRFYLPYPQAFDGAGNVEPGAKLFFYITASSTPKDTYSDAALLVPNANPVIADAAGRFGAIFLGTGDYKVILTDTDGVQIWSADPVAKSGAASATTTTPGIVELATTAEGLVGSSATLVPPVSVVTEMIQQGFVVGTVGGTANALTGTPNRTPSALADGMKAVLTASSTNTSTTTLNWAGLGVVAVKVHGGAGHTACNGGEIVSGNTYEFTYNSAGSCWLVTAVGGSPASINALTEDTTPDGDADFWVMYDTSAKLPKKVKPASLAATQAQCEAAAATGAFITPLNAKWLPGVAKAYIAFTVSGGTPTTTNSRNATLTDNGVGDFTVNITDNLSGAGYAPVAWCRSSVAAAMTCVSADPGDTQTAAAVQVQCRRGTDAATDPEAVGIAIFGDD